MVLLSVASIYKLDTFIMSETTDMMGDITEHQWDQKAHFHTSYFQNPVECSTQYLSFSAYNIGNSPYGISKHYGLHSAKTSFKKSIN